MAMKKEITKDSGLKATYHRIKSIVINELKEQCIITIEEYTDETYREKAKEIDTTRTAIEDIYSQISKTKDTAIANALTEKAETLAKKIENPADYYLGETTVTLDYIPEDTTVAGFYTELKRIEQYSDSEEV